MYYVHLLKSKKTKKLYIGQTNNLIRRLNEHNSGLNRSTKAHMPYEVVYYEAYKSRRDAEKREKQLKHFKQGY